MDSFEEEYFKSLKNLTPNFENKRIDLAKSRIKMLVAAIVRQINDEKQTFDLIVGAGNSGLFVTKIAEFTYESLNIEKPRVLNIPTTRVIKDNKEVIVLKTPQFNPKNIEKLENILFIDDEIMRSITAKTCIEMLLGAKPETKHINLTIIAENHFFEWHYSMPQVSVKFFAYSRLIQGLNGNIGHFITKELFNEIKTSIPEVESHNHAMAIVVSGGLKKIKDHIPYFDFEIEKSIKTPNYQDLKEKYIKDLKELVKDGIKEYKEGKISFRF